VDLLSRPLGDWDLLVGPSVHELLPLANACCPRAGAGAPAAARRRPWLAGLCVGTAAYLASVIVLGHLATPFGGLLTTVWCLVNAAVCLYLASLLLVKSR